MTIGISANSQITINGCLKDSATHEKLPFTQVRLISSGFGMYTDTSGCFTISSPSEQDTLLIRLIGYSEKKIAINTGVHDLQEIYLTTKTHNLNTVLVTPGESRISKLLKNVSKRKKQNNLENLPFYECDRYQKNIIELADFSPELLDKKAMKKMSFIADYVDTTDGSQKLPVFFSEKVGSYYFRKSTEREKEIIEGELESGTLKLDVKELLGANDCNLNFYENNCLLFGKAFQSPIADNCNLFYQYEFMEDDTLNSGVAYHLKFKPKLKGERLFNGEFWIDQKSYALIKITADIASDVNINYVSGLSINQEFEAVDSLFLMRKESIAIKFEIPQVRKKKDPTLGVMTNELIQNNLVQNFPRESKFYDEQLVVIDSAGAMSADFWVEKRHEQLSKKESNVAEMTDSLQNNSSFQFYKKLTQMSFTGYWNLGKIEVGNIYTFYNRNAYEKNRFILSLRTSNLWSENAEVSGFLGYGTGDQDWKYEGRYKWKSKRKRYEMWDFGYRKKIEQLGLIEHIGDVGNAFTSIVSYKPQDKLTLVKKGWLNLEKEWKPWFRTFHSVSWNNYDLLGKLSKMETNPVSMTPMDTGLRSFQIKNQITFSKNERFIGPTFNRFSLGSTLPIVSFGYTVGIKGVLNSEYEFHQFDFIWKHQVHLGALGKSSYAIHAGKIIGEVDFPFTHIHQGNETLYLQEFNFNLMNYYEFASTEWVDVFYEHNFQGLILNRIPLLKRMNMRLAVTGKMAWGRIQNENIEIPEFIGQSEIPYVEVGVGLDNVFKVIRVDFVKRLTHTGGVGADYGVRFRFSPQF